MRDVFLPRLYSLGLVTAPTSLLAQNVVLFDDMTNTFYSDFAFNGSDSGSNPDDVSSIAWSNDSTGGNPGAVFNVSHEHDVDRDEFGTPFGSGDTDVQSFFENNSSLTYTPATQGTINTLSFSLDLKTSDPFDSVYFTVGDSLGSTVAQGLGGTGFLNVVPNGEWQTVTLSGVTQAGLGGRDLAGPLTLDFGFGFTSFAEVSNGPETFLMQADNFRVEINPIPEPSAALLLACRLIGFARRR